MFQNNNDLLFIMSSIQDLQTKISQIKSKVKTLEMLLDNAPKQIEDSEGSIERVSRMYGEDSTAKNWVESDPKFVDSTVTEANDEIRVQKLMLRDNPGEILAYKAEIADLEEELEKLQE